MDIKWSQGLLPGYGVKPALCTTVCSLRGLARTFFLFSFPL